MKGQLDWKQRNHLKALSSASRYQDLKRLKEPRGDCVAGRATRQRAMGDGFFLEARWWEVGVCLRWVDGGVAPAVLSSCHSAQRAGSGMLVFICSRRTRCP